MESPSGLSVSLSLRQDQQCLPSHLRVALGGVGESGEALQSIVLSIVSLDTCKAAGWSPRHRSLHCALVSGVKYRAYEISTHS